MNFSIILAYERTSQADRQPTTGHRHTRRRRSRRHPASSTECANNEPLACSGIIKNIQKATISNVGTQQRQ